MPRGPGAGGGWKRRPRRRWPHPVVGPWGGGTTRPRPPPHGTTAGSWIRRAGARAMMKEERSGEPRPRNKENHPPHLPRQRLAGATTGIPGRTCLRGWGKTRSQSTRGCPGGNSSSRTRSPTNTTKIFARGRIAVSTCTMTKERTGSWRSPSWTRRGRRRTSLGRWPRPPAPATTGCRRSRSWTTTCSTTSPPMPTRRSTSPFSPRA
mmetsp:Transcript_63277/g.200144  ORF Transcript_63277/g.200144 Transcript_63277/m.200144 type:complete len:207 (-) Transcript_63277:231-851(-)